MQVKKLSSPERYADGNCLYVTISGSGSKSWLLRIVVRGRRRDMGLGSVDLVSLEEARDLARQYRRIARSGGDPKADPPVEPIIPISKSSWWDGISKGKYPKPIKLGENTTVWREDDIRKLIDSL